MNPQTLSSILLWTQFAAFFVLCVILPFRFVLRSGRFWRGVIFAWLASAAFSFCSSMLGWYLFTHIDKGLYDGFFDGPQFLAFAFLGWLSPGMMVSGIAWLLFWRRKRSTKKKESGNLCAQS
jgi:hypothetical protein